MRLLLQLLLMLKLELLLLLSLMLLSLQLQLLLLLHLLCGSGRLLTLLHALEHVHHLHHRCLKLVVRMSAASRLRISSSCRASVAWSRRASSESLDPSA